MKRVSTSKHPAVTPAATHQTEYSCIHLKDLASLLNQQNEKFRMLEAWMREDGTFSVIIYNEINTEDDDGLVLEYEELRNFDDLMYFISKLNPIDLILIYPVGWMETDRFYLEIRNHKIILD